MLSYFLNARVLCLILGFVWMTGNNPAYAQLSYKVSGQSGATLAQTWLRYYKDDGASISSRSAMTFIRTHPDFPAMDSLRTRAEKSMPFDMADQEVLSWFSQNPPQTAFGMKIYTDALIRHDQHTKAKLLIKSWWVRARLTADDQSRALDWFSDVLSREDHAKRLNMLIHEGQYTNARKLAYRVGQSYQALIEARIALRSGKGNADYALSSVPASMQSDEGLLYDRLVYRRKKDIDSGALEILSKQPPESVLYDPDDWGKERSILARRFFEKKSYTKAYNISAKHGLKGGIGFASNEWFAGWIALEFLNKPWEAFKHFEKLYHAVESPISKSRAAYWAGAASAAMKYPAVATEWYQAAAQYPSTFYGQLSLQNMKKDAQFSSDIPSASDLKKSDLAKAARWLAGNGYKTEAGLFLSKMTEIAKTPSDFSAVAATANDLSMKSYSIKAAQECEKKTGVLMVSYAFPKLEKYMSGVETEWALVHALIRQESRYDPAVVSPAGARGLMQLMPGTAKETAKKAGLSHDISWLISRPKHNIQLGSLYIQRLVNNYDGNYAMALAGYNAGPGRVKEWVALNGDPRDANVDLVNWIEMIPIYETRNYVQRVLEGVYVYRHTLPRGKAKPTQAQTHYN